MFLAKLSDVQKIITLGSGVGTAIFILWLHYQKLHTTFEYPPPILTLKIQVYVWLLCEVQIESVFGFRQIHRPCQMTQGENHSECHHGPKIKKDLSKSKLGTAATHSKKKI